MQRSDPYETIRDIILAGTLAPGAPLIESVLAELCGVSRTPVREALTRLEQDGLVERVDRGLVVRRRSPQEIIDIYEVRAVLEGQAARSAAQRHTEVDRAHLLRALRLGAESDQGDVDAIVRANREFHAAVWQAGRNEALTDVLGRLSLHLLRYPSTTLSYPGRWSRAVEQHSAMTDAILSRDLDAAERIARDHFNEARDIRLALWETDSEEWGAHLT